MTPERARAEFPLWCAQDIRIYDPDHKTTEPTPFRMRAEEKFRKFWKKYKISIIAGVLFAAWTCTVSDVTAYVVEKKTTERVTSELRAGFSEYLAQMEYERSAADFLTGDASLQTAMDAEADSLARLLYGYRGNSLRDRKTLLWCVLARVDSSAYPGSVDTVVNQAQQWMFYKAENPVRADDRQLALEQLKEWHDGRYPAGFSSDYVYAEWSSTDIALRNTWEKTSTTSWWRFPE